MTFIFWASAPQPYLFNTLLNTARVLICFANYDCEVADICCASMWININENNYLIRTKFP